MTKWLFILCFSFSSLIAMAHQPDISSTMLIEQGENKWVLQVRASLTAFEYEIEAQFGKNAYATPEEFKDLVLKHLKENLAIRFNNGDDIALGKSYVKLGHETSVVFEMLDVPTEMKGVFVKNSSFKDIGRNQSALIILKNGFSKEQFVLNTSNEHQANLKAKDGKFELLPNSNSNIAGLFSWSSGLILLVFLAFSSGLFIYLKKRKQKVSLSVPSF